MTDHSPSPRLRLRNVLGEAIDWVDTSRLSPTQRSGVTNGTRSFIDGDERSPWARRWRDLVGLMSADLGGTLSQAQLSLVKTAATLRCQIETMEGGLSKGETVDLAELTNLAGHLRRCLVTLGLEKTPRKAKPRTLAEVVGRPEQAS